MPSSGERGALERQLILVVEDDPHMSELICLTLEREGFSTLSAVDGALGLQLVRERRPALMVLDLMLPEMDGFEVCRRVRQESRVPLLMLTARGEAADRIQGLELGADDYLVKPFSPRELVARIRAILRRAGGSWSSCTPHLSFPNLRVDIPGREVRVGDAIVQLAPKEFDLLVLLAQNPGQVFSRETLLREVWGYAFAGEGRTVDEHVRRLRSKIESLSHPYRYIRTVWGAGYKFEVMV